MSTVVKVVVTVRTRPRQGTIDYKLTCIPAASNS